MASRKAMDKTPDRMLQAIERMDFVDETGDILRGILPQVKTRSQEKSSR
jgi:hypothetical protein